jgi:hypothetical protein
MIRTLRRGWNRLIGTLFRRSAEDADLADELHSHIQLLAEENIRRGVRRKRHIAARGFSSAVSNQQRKATAISVVCQLSTPSLRISGMPFAEFVGIPASLRSLSFP